MTICSQLIMTVCLCTLFITCAPQVRTKRCTGCRLTSVPAWTSNVSASRPSTQGTSSFSAARRTGGALVESVHCLSLCWCRCPSLWSHFLLRLLLLSAVTFCYVGRLLLRCFVCRAAAWSEDPERKTSDRRAVIFFYQPKEMSLGPGNIVEGATPNVAPPARL